MESRVAVQAVATPNRATRAREWRNLSADAMASDLIQSCSAGVKSSQNWAIRSCSALTWA